MEKQYFNIKKYPKSKSKKQCLGPCYYPKTQIVHPTLLEIVSNTEPFCPVNPWKYVDPTNGENTMMSTDMCFAPTENKNISNKELELNILAPFIDFDSNQFLKIYFEIFSFEDCVDWLDRNKTEPIKSKMRILNSGLIAFGQNVDLFDNRLSVHVMDIIKQKKIKEIYDKIFPYINVENEIATLSQNNLDKKEMSTERINYISQTFLTKEEITKFLTKYFAYKKEKWNYIKNHINSITLSLTEYILNKIILSIQNAK